jgi:hypothetical protein
MTARRFPPPWSEEQKTWFAVRDRDGQHEPSSAPSCSRTGSRSPSIASRNTERANSSGFTVLTKRGPGTTQKQGSIVGGGN